jgi:hypothetical protein
METQYISREIKNAPSVLRGGHEIRTSAGHERLPRRGKMLPALIAFVLALLSFDVLVTTASAKPVVVGRIVTTKTALERNCMIDGGKMTTESSGIYSCLNVSTGLSTNCSSLGACEIVCNGKDCGNVRKPGGAPVGSKVGNGPKPTAKPTAGGSVPRPGRSNPSGGGVIVRDHRNPVVVASPSKGAPPAAAPGTNGGNAPNATTPGPAVRDHRPGGNSERKH